VLGTLGELCNVTGRNLVPYADQLLLLIVDMLGAELGDASSVRKVQRPDSS
jgi:hypothetical protein